MLLVWEEDENYQGSEGECEGGLRGSRLYDRKRVGAFRIFGEGDVLTQFHLRVFSINACLQRVCTARIPVPSLSASSPATLCLAPPHPDRAGQAWQGRALVHAMPGASGCCTLRSGHGAIHWIDLGEAALVAPTNNQLATRHFRLRAHHCPLRLPRCSRRRKAGKMAPGMSLYSVNAVLILSTVSDLLRVPLPTTNDRRPSTLFTSPCCPSSSLAARTPLLFFTASAVRALTMTFVSRRTAQDYTRK